MSAILPVRRLLRDESSALTFASENESRLSVSVSRGGSVLLPCSVQNEAPPYTLEWHREGQGAIYTVFSGAEFGHPADGYEDKIRHAANSSLLIENVQTQDAGEYFCLVKPLGRPATKIFGSKVQLNVNTLPVITRASPAIIYKSASDSLTLFCDAEGAPAPSVYWEKDKRRIQNEARISLRLTSLHITSLRSDDEGRYNCIASNSEGQVQHEMRLLFITEPKFETAPQNMTALDGAQLFWPCRATAEPMNITYAWYFGDRKIIYANSLGLRSKILPNGDLHISKVKKEDTGWYHCGVTNGHSPEKRTSAYLDVQYFPEILPSTPTIQRIPLGLSGSLRCDIDANPQLSAVVWTKAGKVLSFSGSDGGTSSNGSNRLSASSEPVTFSDHGAKLVFRNVSNQDSGLYTCQAFNGHGKSNLFELHAIVSEPPFLLEFPPAQFHKREGDAIALKCVADGNPKPMVWWRKKSKPVKDMKEKSEGEAMLTFANLRRTDHGRYECVVQNDVASLTRESFVVIEDTAPQPPENLTVSSFGPFDARVSWQPGFDGGHTQVFELRYREFDGGPWLVAEANAQTSFLVTNLQPETKYELFVVPKNSLGEGFKSESLILRTKELDYRNAVLPTDASGSTYLPDIKRSIGPKPDPPANLAVNADKEFLKFTWDAPDEIRVKVQYYTVEFKPAHESASSKVKRSVRIPPLDGFSSIGKEIVGATSLKVNPKSIPAQPGEVYDFRVRANTLTAYSDPSNVVTYKITGVTSQTALIASISGSLLLLALILFACFIARRVASIRSAKKAAIKRGQMANHKRTNGFANGNGSIQHESLESFHDYGKHNGHAGHNGHCHNHNGHVANGTLKSKSLSGEFRGNRSRINRIAQRVRRLLFVDENDHSSNRRSKEEISGPIGHCDSRTSSMIVATGIGRRTDALYSTVMPLAVPASTAAASAQKESSTVSTRWLFCTNGIASSSEGGFSTCSSSVPAVGDSSSSSAQTSPAKPANTHHLSPTTISAPPLTPEQTCIRTLTKAVAKQESSLSEYLRTHKEDGIRAKRFEAMKTEFGKPQKHTGGDKKKLPAATSKQSVASVSQLLENLSGRLQNEEDENVMTKSVHSAPADASYRLDQMSSRAPVASNPSGKKSSHNGGGSNSYHCFQITSTVNNDASRSPVEASPASTTQRSASASNIGSSLNHSFSPQAKEPPLRHGSSIRFNSSNRPQRTKSFSVEPVGNAGYIFKFPQDNAIKRGMSDVTEESPTSIRDSSGKQSTGDISSKPQSYTREKLLQTIKHLRTSHSQLFVAQKFSPEEEGRPFTERAIDVPESLLKSAESLTNERHPADANEEEDSASEANSQNSAGAIERLRSKSFEYFAQASETYQQMVAEVADGASKQSLQQASAAEISFKREDPFRRCSRRQFSNSNGGSSESFCNLEEPSSFIDRAVMVTALPAFAKIDSNSAVTETRDAKKISLGTMSPSAFSVPSSRTHQDLSGLKDQQSHYERLAQQFETRSQLVEFLLQSQPESVSSTEDSSGSSGIGSHESYVLLNAASSSLTSPSDNLNALHQTPTLIDSKSRSSSGLQNPRQSTKVPSSSRKQPSVNIQNLSKFQRHKMPIAKQRSSEEDILQEEKLAKLKREFENSKLCRDQMNANGAEHRNNYSIHDAANIRCAQPPPPGDYV